MIIRPPAVAGKFYDLKPEMLKKQLKSCFNHSLGPKKIKDEEDFIATVVPHAGYPFSGHVAAWSYSKIKKANYIILGSSHGFGSKFAVMKEGIWKTPLGGVKINKEVASKFIENCPLFEYDILAHQGEHSIETQLPFLQFRFKDDFEFVPITVRNEFPSFDYLDECTVAGKAIADILKKQKGKWIIIMSSDFSHSIPHEYAKSVDNYVIQSILRLDERDFFARIQEKNASICGFGAIATGMIASKELGAKKGKLLKYSTSGDVIRDKSSVVGYASIVFR